MLDWSAVDKAALIMLSPLPFAVVGLFRVAHLMRDPAAEPYMDRHWLGVMNGVLIAVLAMSPIFVANWLVIRARKPDSRLFIGVWMTAWLTGFACGSYLLGAVSTPMFGALLAIICATFLFFDLRLASYLASYSILSFFVPLAFVAFGFLPYGPVFREPPLVGERMSASWVTTTAIFALAIAIIPTTMLAEVVRRWQTRDAELLDLARLDPLTHASNRRYFFDRLEIELDRAIRHRAKLAVLLLDIDFFKNVNDRYGHLAGDAALVHIAELLRQTVSRRTDVVGRYGGEEFAILLSETDLDGARQVAERCRIAIEMTPCRLPNGKSIRLTASLGVVVPAPEEGADGVVRRVDEALYRAKNAGRNCVIVAA